MRIDVPFAVVLVAAALAWTLPLRAPNCNTGSHFALVQAIAHGQRTVDALHGESCDVSWWHGHYYANKAPGLALVTVPWYLLLRAVDAVAAPARGTAYPAAMRAVPRRDVWLMALWGAALPSLLLLWLVRRYCDARVPGTGTAAAALLAFATILLPFGGLFFSHALGALLDFAGFAAATSAGASKRRLALAGALLGFAIVVEYPNALAAAVVAAFVVAAHRRALRGAVAFLAGACAGVAPLPLFNAWAFGSPVHLSYVGAVLVPGRSGHDVLGANTAGFFGTGVPTAGHLATLLAGDKGLLLTSPILVLLPLGLRELRRAGLRRDFAAACAIAAAYLLFNAGYYSPIGGATPGPRFLICTLPFLALPLVLASRRYLLPAALLLATGVSVLLAGDVTQPLIGRHYTMLTWWHWLTHGGFTATIIAPTSHGAGPALLLVAVVAVGLGAAGSSLRAPSPRAGEAPG